MIPFGPDGRPRRREEVIYTDEPVLGQKIRVVTMRVDVPILVSRDCSDAKIVEAAVRRVWQQIPDASVVDPSEACIDGTAIADDVIHYTFGMECMNRAKTADRAVADANKHGEELEEHADEIILDDGDDERDGVGKTIEQAFNDCFSDLVGEEHE